MYCTRNRTLAQSYSCVPSNSWNTVFLSVACDTSEEQVHSVRGTVQKKKKNTQELSDGAPLPHPRRKGAAEAQGLYVPAAERTTHTTYGTRQRVDVGRQEEEEETGGEGFVPAHLFVVSISREESESRKRLPHFDCVIDKLSRQGMQLLSMRGAGEVGWCLTPASAQELSRQATNSEQARHLIVHDTPQKTVIGWSPTSTLFKKLLSSLAKKEYYFFAVPAAHIQPLPTDSERLLSRAVCSAPFQIQTRTSEVQPSRRLHPN